MPYTTPDDVKAVLARDDTADSGTAASLDVDRLTQAIVDAETEVDGKLKVRYTTPFSDPVPEMVAQITRDIAAYLADLTFRQGRDFSSDLDPVYLRYKRAQDNLKGLVDGTFTLEPVGATSALTGAVFNPYDGKLFEMSDFGLVFGVPQRRISDWWEWQ